MELNVSSRSHDDHTIVTISGEIDLYTAPRLHGELAALIADGKPARVVVDMSGVEFCDSTGMNVLLSCLRRARERGGELEIASPKPAVRKILQVTGLDSVFTLVDDAEVSTPKPAVPQNLSGVSRPLRPPWPIRSGPCQSQAVSRSSSLR